MSYIRCDRPLPQGGAWCSDCATELLDAAAADYCQRCGQGLGPHLGHPHGCPECEGHRMYFEAFARVGSYAGILGRLIRAYKFEHRQHLDRCLGRLLADAIAGKSWASDLEALVPVPTTRLTRVLRGFHPVGQLATEAARVLALPVCPAIQVHRKHHRQTGLTRAQRQANVREVFHVRPRAALPAVVCIVDDVSTTGATLREIARQLKAAGVERVYAAALAKTAPDLSGR